MALIRYPGSKAKLARRIIERFPDWCRGSLWAVQGVEYREPFFGSGEMGLYIMRQVLAVACDVWINDVDASMASLWRAVYENPIRLNRLVGEFKPTAEAFYDFKERDGDLTDDHAEVGFRKLALHRMSVSGFGVKSGGPIGGRHQRNRTYSVDCRWTPGAIQDSVADYHDIMRRFKSLRITALDFRELVDSAPETCFIYLDPPYYEKGGQLYKFNMSPEDHEDLATRLRSCKARWVLSYDDHPEIRRMYSWAKIEPITVTYSNAVCKEAKRPKNQEVVITQHDK